MKSLTILLSALFVVAKVYAMAANPDQASTLVGTPITLLVLTNDAVSPTNRLAIHQVTQPAHGHVLINSNGVGTTAELSTLFQFAARQLSNTVVQVANANQYPRATDANGNWISHPVGIYNWISGFFPGSLWYIYEQTGDTNFRRWAESWTAGIAPMQYSTDVDDVGFMVYPSFGAGYRLTGNPDWRAIVLQTARSFSTRYNAAARCLSTWGAVTNQPFDVFVDTMMNLPILWDAYALGGDTNFFTYAYNHSERTMFNHVRADGSTFHIVDYDGKTGAMLHQGTFAGASDSSTWARGQSWAIYGFALAYKASHDVRFLQTAQRTADYFMANLPPDYVPYWDFQAPGIPNAPRDSSAASIALCGLLELSQLATNLDDAARYWQAAHNIFSSLASSNYLATGTSTKGILLHGTGEPPHFGNSEVDVSLIYGDYYFIEALRRYAETYRRDSLTYIPEPGFEGTDTFTYQVCDDAGNCSTATVTVAVQADSPAPFSAQIDFDAETSSPMISFPSTVGREYWIEGASELSDAVSWRVLATNIPGTGARISFTDTNSPASRFYRIGAK